MVELSVLRSCGPAASHALTRRDEPTNLPRLLPAYGELEESLGLLLGLLPVAFDAATCRFGSLALGIAALLLSVTSPLALCVLDGRSDGRD